MRIEDIMIKEVITVGLDSSVKEVAQLLAKNKIHAVPVVDGDSKQVKGIIAEGDLFVSDLSLHLPSYIDFIHKNDGGDKILKISKDKVQQLLDTRAKDIMTADCTTVNQAMSLGELLGMFKDTKIVTFPVVNDDNSLVGIITLSDILGLL